MARNRRKKALYEVISKTSFKAGYEDTVEHLHSPGSVKDQQGGAKSDLRLPKKLSRWPTRPKAVQFNDGRVEMSIPFELAITVVLGIVLLVLVAFRLGQNLSAGKKAAADKVPAKAVAEKTIPAVVEMQKSGPLVPAVMVVAEAAVAAEGDHRIVLKQYHRRRDLEAAQRYFSANGIETLIQQRSGGYFLVTKGTFENPQKAGTDGYAMRKSIIETGARYKASSGYESFAPNLFRDAYGEKVK